MSTEESMTPLKGSLNWGKKYNIHDVIPLKTSDICVAQWVRLKCKYGCKQYGTSWCCPPETPASDKTRDLLNEYEQGAPALRLHSQQSLS